MSAEKIKITVKDGVMTEAIGANGRRTQRPPWQGIQVEAWDAGNGFYNFDWNGTTWQIRDYKVTLGWGESRLPKVLKHTD